MAPMTYFVALLFLRNEDGDLVAGEAQDPQSASAVESLTRRMAATSAGAVAFSRTGEPATGEFKDAVVLKSFGEMPSIAERCGMKPPCSARAAVRANGYGPCIASGDKHVRK